MKTAVILYEPEQLPALYALLKKWSRERITPIIVSLDAEIDYALQKRGIPFISGKTLQNRIAPDSYMRTDALTRELCESKHLSFLYYRGVSLLEPLRLSIYIYFLFLFYYMDVIKRFLESATDIERLVVLTSVVPVSKTSGPLGIEEAGIAAEAVRKVAEERGIRYEPYDTLSVSFQTKNRGQEWVFSFKRAVFGIALSLWNVLMALRPRRSIRLLASDYWRNIAPILRELPEAELILLDRSESFKAGFSNMWRYKTRFVHIDHFLPWREKRQALKYAKECMEEWMAVRKEVLASVDTQFQGVHFLTTVERIMTHLIETAIPDIISDIEGTYAMYKRLSPDTILLRASVSGQRHFAILPLVAREVGIPALEVQHGGEYLGPGSATRRHAAHFIAAYGPLVCDEFRALGYAAERLLSVGSPRFDAYVKDRKKIEMSEGVGISILSNTPSGNIGERYGTYSVEEYFKALGEAIRTVPDARLTIASRSTSRSGFLEEARGRGLAGVAYEDASTTPLPDLFVKSDLFVCSHSTVVYEALLYRLPVVIASFAPVEKMMSDFHFGPFEEAGAVAIAHTPEELREIIGKLATDLEARARMSAAGESFMQKQFSFDGHAAERIANKIRAWVR